MSVFNNPDLSDRILLVKVAPQKSEVNGRGTKRRRSEPDEPTDRPVPSSLDEEEAEAEPSSADAQPAGGRSEARFHISRGVLALASTFFRTLFTSPIAGERDDREIEITLFDQSELVSFETALRFCYHNMTGSDPDNRSILDGSDHIAIAGSVELTPESVTGLVRMADRYGIPDLMETTLRGAASPDRSISKRFEIYSAIWEMTDGPSITFDDAHRPSSTDPHLHAALQAQCEEILKTAPSTIILVNSFALMKAIGYHPLLMWLRSPSLKHSCEEDLLKILKVWSEGRSPSLEEIRTLYGEIRLAFVSSNYLSYAIEPERLKGLSPYLREMLLKVAAYRFSNQSPADAARLGVNITPRPITHSTLDMSIKVTLLDKQSCELIGMGATYTFTLKVDGDRVKIAAPSQNVHNIRVYIMNDLTAIPLGSAGVELSKVRYPGSKFVDGERFRIQFSAQWRLATGPVRSSADYRGATVSR